MDKEVDSLEHIQAMTTSIASDPKRDSYSRQPLEEPTYQISRDSRNDPASLRSIRNISEIIDPEFRLPAPSSSAFREALDEVSKNCQIPSILKKDSSNANIVPQVDQYSNRVKQKLANSNTGCSTHHLTAMSDQISTRDSNMPFVSANPTTSFSDLAKQSTIPDSHSGTAIPDTMTDALNLYGPQTFTESGQIGCTNNGPIARENQAQNVPKIYINQPTISVGQPMGPPRLSFRNSNAVRTSSGAPSFLSVQVPSYDSGLGDFRELPPFVPSKSQIRGPTDSYSNIEPLYSPPYSCSPPLDKIDKPKNSSNSLSNAPINSSKPSSTSVNRPINDNRAPGKIPKKTTVSSERYDEMNLLDLEGAFRKFEGELIENRRNSRYLERQINELTRNAKGKNIELDPQYRQLKDELKYCDSNYGRLKGQMKKIEEKLWDKFKRRIKPLRPEPSKLKHPNQPPQPQQSQFKRIKMSTAAPTPQRIDSKERERLNQKEVQRHKNIALKLSESKLWCESCDVHFNILDDYLKHMHQREHLRSTRHPTPWRKSKDLMDERRTYDIIKSICSRIKNEIPTFSLSSFDQALNPDCENKDKVLKELALDRERGFYCKLCQASLCDNIEASQHLRSHEHNFAHAKSVALNSQHEAAFQMRLAKSLKKQDLSSSPLLIDIAPVPSKNKPNNIGTHIIQYKKPTSHIVDDHDIISEKFPKNITTQRSKGLKDSDDESKATRNKKLPRMNKVISKSSLELVPIGHERRPTALKRLKTRKVSTPRYSSSQSSEIEIIKEVYLDIGDPDSPFPEYKLIVSGNMHANVLKDKRLKDGCRVKLNRINLDDYKDILLPETSLWTRVNQLVAKKETLRLIDNQIVTKPTFFGSIGSSIPVDVEPDSPDTVKNKSGSNGKDVRTPTLMAKDGIFIATEIDKKAMEKDDKKMQDMSSKDESISDLEENSEFNMALLENFFCDKTT